jgi:diguanylate cyclase (GGDEF)-like protein/PAS domain S-box-containing protein
MLDALSDPVLVIDADGVLCYANSAAEHLFGYPVRERLGESVVEFVAPIDQGIAIERIASTSSRPGPAPPLELRVVTADGSHCWVEIVTNNCLDVPEVNGLVISVRDITARRLLEAAGREADARFQAAFADAPIGMALVALDGRFLQVNAALCDLSGYSPVELHNLTFQDITHPDDLDEDLAHVSALLAGRVRAYSMEKRYLRADGGSVWVTLSVSLVRGDDGEPLYFVAQMQDTTNRRRDEDALRHASFHDALTGVANRRALDHLLDDHATATSPGLTIVSCDLDNLKTINDRYGHPAGDAMLIAVANRLKRLVRSDDLVARVGGDEFVIVCPTLSEDAATSIADRVIGIVETSLDVDDIELTPRISVGVATRDPADADTDQLVARADEAMYQQKRRRREKVRPAAAPVRPRPESRDRPFLAP